MNKLLGTLVAVTLIVSSAAIWRGGKENTSQPHVPTWKKVAQR
jgi:hypothetical protein